MNNPALQQQILTAWRAEPGLSPERALAIANEILLNHPHEKRTFATWFERNGAAAVARNG